MFLVLKGLRRNGFTEHDAALAEAMQLAADDNEPYCVVQVLTRVEPLRPQVRIVAVAELEVADKIKHFVHNPLASPGGM